MSWVGGKKNLRDEVLARFPPYYERYIEVFGGAGWVLFHKPPGMDFEVYNDFNGNLSNLYRCVRDKPNKLKYKLRYVLNSREDFDRIALLHKRGIFEKLCDADRASKFYQLIRYSYASGLDSFGSQPHSMWSDFPMIDLAARRLQKVVVENKDFEKLIRQYDRPVSFFYCDPPYFATENYYKDVGFKTNVFVVVFGCKVRWIAIKKADRAVVLPYQFFKVFILNYYLLQPPCGKVDHREVRPHRMRLTSKAVKSRSIAVPYELIEF